MLMAQENQMPPSASLGFVLRVCMLKLAISRILRLIVDYGQSPWSLRSPNEVKSICLCKHSICFGLHLALPFANIIS
jgi:hypothetical protein